MPQASSSGSGSGSSSGAKSSSGGSTTKRSSGTTKRSSAATKRSSSASGTRAKKSTRATKASSKSSRSTARSRTASKASASKDDARLDAIAQRLRKLNERIIDAGKEAGETTLTSYEKALKAIATGIEKGPGSSDVDWISNLATAQAKFIRDVTNSWTAAARNVLK
jgi:hypothetical protein